MIKVNHYRICAIEMDKLKDLFNDLTDLKPSFVSTLTSLNTGYT